MGAIRPSQSAKQSVHYICQSVVFDEERASFLPDSFSVLPATCFCSENTWIFTGKWEDITQTVFLSLPPTTSDICSAPPPQFLLCVSLCHSSYHLPPPSFFLTSFLLLQSSFLSIFTWDSVAILRDLSAHTHCGSRVRVIMKWLGKED